ncbi:ERF family protein [Fusobacterium nucleatum]|uniref:ERF family protein n=1 Tax=Fusobacterium nucleatum TaxID=851 RepID=UPI0030D1AF55
MENTNIYKKLNEIQIKLKAPKSQFNKFGNYKYRNCEDILEALKPLLNEFKTVISLKDEIVFIEGRFYVKATVTLIDSETGEAFSTSAFAREEETKKGQDGSQITGASSSYARKYALNGLFAIDDTKDSDSTNTHGKEEKTEDERKKNAIEAINKLADTEEKTEKVFDMIAKFNKNSLLDCTPEELKKVYTEIKKKGI